MIICTGFVVGSVRLFVYSALMTAIKGMNVQVRAGDDLRYFQGDADPRSYCNGAEPGQKELCGSSTAYRGNVFAWSFEPLLKLA